MRDIGNFGEWKFLCGRCGWTCGGLGAYMAGNRHMDFALL